ncbi:hypothetical protein CROQUDRAFT_704905 [Cronartium quercuum f. sp. fusiforme G11]|uniref:Uncharacterized protein n=1 Tax=Cronartium quercuum f. sp. fusiforme G11 TaxID=708437 RepID=A0A9P6NF64_9BASI|nr:hypothetical protein CROQUDRAFT_704905 [Cronartium quercuum f. sp. fusiforme G11]
MHSVLQSSFASSFIVAFWLCSLPQFLGVIPSIISPRLLDSTVIDIPENLVELKFYDQLSDHVSIKSESGWNFWKDWRGLNKDLEKLQVAPFLHVIKLQDLRKSKMPTLKDDGFTWITRRSTSGKNPTITPYNRFWYEDRLIREAQTIVKDLTGAAATVVQKAEFRFNSPIDLVHSDVSPEGAKAFVEAFTQSFFYKTKEERKFINLIKEGKRYVFINIWMPLETVERDPLALCSTSSVNQAEDSKDVNIRDVERVRYWKHTDKQKWYYLPDQTRDEAFVFIQHDSKAKDGRFAVPHTSFKYHRVENPKPRKSFELKLVAVFNSDKVASLPDHARSP